ncbi:MAG: prepilin-type N-terminal cleavage/methylation domain-containing protein [Phycisphaerae bacterium]|nr:prepilin-type N-terminal cleavage/methylation domain-containing protein [Phycisphaerae bacterium]
MVRRMKREGVTLIELLIVVLILAALSAIAIPRISQSAHNAKQNACDTNIDVINSAIEMYNAENGSYPAAIGDVTGSTTYFPDGAPVCPLSGVATSYTMNATTKRVACSH